MTRSSLRSLQLILWIAVFIALLALAWFAVIKPRIEHDRLLATIGAGEYQLETTSGERFTFEDLKGQPTAVFFGFTHCPDVCPTTLGEVMAWQDDLAEEDKELRVLFFTVDPERDTAEVLGDYVSWVPGVIGITGDPDEVEKAVKAFRIYAQKVPLEDGGYNVNHSTSVMLFDQGGNYAGLIAYQEEHERAMRTIHKLLAG